MKFNINKSLNIFIGSLIVSGGLVSCSEDLDYKHGINTGEGYINVTFDIPEPTVEYIGTRAGDNPTVKKIVVYAFTDENTFTTRDLTYETQGSLTLPINKDVVRYEFVAIPDDISYEESKKPSENFTSDPTKNILWGSITKDKISPSETNTISLLRHNAKVTVSTATGNITESGQSFTLTNFQVYGTAQIGSAGPLYTNYDSTSKKVTRPTVKDNVGYGFNLTEDLRDEDLLPANGTAQIFEGENKESAVHGRIIIKGKYGDKECYYPIEFKTREKKEGASNDYSEDPATFDYEYVNILRNHHYKVEIQYVRAEGWSTLEEALKAKPDNRLTVMITEENTAIKDVVACRDYALGVTDSEIIFGGDASRVSFDIVHTYTDSDDNYPQPEVSYKAGTGEWKKANDNPGGSGWITEVSMPETGETYTDMYVGESTANTQGKKFTVTVTCQQNPDDQNSRSGEFIIKVGDLERKVTLTQQARDYLRGADRTVILEIPAYGNKTAVTVIPDYFAWIDQRTENGINKGSICYGVRDEDNRGVKRNDGLIFPPLDMYERKSVAYYIPVKGSQEDIYAISDRNNAEYLKRSMVNRDGKNYFKVELQNFNSGLTDDIIIQIRGGEETINYRIYTTGFFHKLTDEMVELQTPGTAPKTGWYYYEFVQNGNQYILDRNLGASSNAPYISTYQHYSQEAIGGFFQVANARASVPDGGHVDQSDKFWLRRDISDKTILSALDMDMGSMHIPTRGDLETLSITLDKPNSIISSSARTATVEVSGLVKDNKIYIPHAGYYEGTDNKLSTRANIWTSTIYSEPQGFFPDYIKYANNNYGFWYYYLDGQPKSENISDFNQIRCTDATANDFLDATINRYMPIRLVWGAPKEDESFKNGDYITFRWNKKLYANSGENYNFTYLWTAEDSRVTWELNDVPIFDKKLNEGEENNTLSGYYQIWFPYNGPSTKEINYMFASNDNWRDETETYTFTINDAILRVDNVQNTRTWYITVSWWYTYKDTI